MQHYIFSRLIQSVAILFGVLFIVFFMLQMTGDPVSLLMSRHATPPDLMAKPVHCQFAWRCTHVQKICWQGIPGLREISPSHQAACFFNFSDKRPLNP